MNFIIFFRHLLIIENLSRSAWHDSITILFDGYSHGKSALFQVEENLEQKYETRATVKWVLNKINKLVFTVLLCLWKTILERFLKKTTQITEVRYCFKQYM